MDVSHLTPLQHAQLSIAILDDVRGVVYAFYICLGFFTGDWVTQMGRERDMIRHLRPASAFYFATRISALIALLSGCVALSAGGLNHTIAQGTINTFLAFESLALGFVQAILLLRTLALWQGYHVIRWSASLALIMCSAVHFVKLYAYAGKSNSLGLWFVEASPPRGGKLRAVPYFISLGFGTLMMILTVLGAQRQSGNYTTQELLRMQPGRGATKRRDFIASRILRGQLLYYCVMVCSTGATAFLITFDVLKGYNQFIPLPLNVVLTCSSACNIVLAMRCPAKGTVELDHGLSLLPPRNRRVQIDIETDQVHGYPPTLEDRSVSSPSLQKEAMGRAHSSSTNDISSPESHDQDRSRSPISNATPLRDPFEARADAVSRALFDDGVEEQQSVMLRFRRNTLDGANRIAAVLPHLHRNGASVDVDAQHGQAIELTQRQQQRGIDGVQVEHNVVTHVVHE